MSTPVFDLGSILNVQSNYIKNLSTDDEELISKLSQVDAGLNELKSSYVSADITSNDILTKQAKVSEIVTTENERLNEVKQIVDDVVSGENRNIQLNESYRLRQQQYTKMKIIFSFALLLCVLFHLLGKYVPVIPSVIITIFIIITITTAIIWCITIYTMVLQRDKTNFNELDIDNTTYPSTSEASEQQRRAMLQGDLLGASGKVCSGSACCNPKPDGEQGTSGNWETYTKWNEIEQKCLPEEGFTTIQSRYSNSDIQNGPTTTSVIPPISNSDKYSKY